MLLSNTVKMTDQHVLSTTALSGKSHLEWGRGMVGIAQAVSFTYDQKKPPKNLESCFGIGNACRIQKKWS
jgi:hypothetical protein